MVEMTRRSTNELGLQKMVPVMTEIKTQTPLASQVLWVVLYGCQFWMLNDVLRRNWRWRKCGLLRECWKYCGKKKKKNRETLALSGPKRSPPWNLWERGKQFIGPVYRKEGLEHVSKSMWMEGRKDRRWHGFKYPESFWLRPMESL